MKSKNYSLNLQNMTNFTWLYSLSRKEISRVFRIWKQTIIPPVVTWSLYFLIFWVFIWSQIDDINWIPYIEFIIPGFIMMSAITASYANVSSSFFGSKFNKSVEELIVSPMKEWEIILAYVLGWVTRWIVIWAVILGVSQFFRDITVSHPFLALLFLILTSTLFSLAGLFNGFFAKSFDDVSIIPNFVITPLVYLGWVFFPLTFLPETWQTVTQFNPILYLINGFRYAFLDFSEVNVTYSALVSLAFVVALFLGNLRLMKKGYWIKN